MIDIHTHILPGIDDGVGDITDAILMAELALEGGVDTMIATPHCNIPWENNEKRGEIVAGTYQGFRSFLEEKQIPLKILPGMEIYATEDMGEKIRQGELISLNESGYYLVEFGFKDSMDWCSQCLQDIFEAGGIPIIAHAERFHCIQRQPERIHQWLEMGCQIQVNKGSIFGSFGYHAKKTAMWMLYHDCVTYVASDAHSPYQRNTFMGDVRDFLSEELSKKKALELLQNNAEKYLVEKESNRKSSQNNSSNNR